MFKYKTGTFLQTFASIILLKVQQKLSLKLLFCPIFLRKRWTLFWHPLNPWYNCLYPVFQSPRQTCFVKKETSDPLLTPSKPLIRLLVSRFSKSPTNVFLKKETLDPLSTPSKPLVWLLVSRFSKRGTYLVNFDCF